MAALPAEQSSPTRSRSKKSGGSADAPSEQFSVFLERKKVAALNVVRGTAPSTRRLLVGEPETRVVQYAVAITPATASPNAVDAERRILLDIEGRLRPALSATLPRVLQDVDVDRDKVGLVMSGVPGLAAGGSRNDASPRVFLSAVAGWLAALWQDSSGTKTQVDLGAVATQSLLSNHIGSARLEPTLDAIVRARRRLADLEVATTLTHGCLCPRHAMTAGDRVTGVDDWGLGGTGDPLRDLGRAAVRVAAERLPEVLAGRTSFAGTVRHFVTSGLSLMGLSRQLWREVVILALLELACEAFDRGDPEQLVLLGKATTLAFHAER